MSAFPFVFCSVFLDELCAVVSVVFLVATPHEVIAGIAATMDEIDHFNQSVLCGVLAIPLPFSSETVDDPPNTI